MIYEASVRNWDPVNGCFGVIKRMEMQVSELKYRLAIEKEELNALQKPFIADSVPKVEVTQELNALQKPLIADSVPKVEVKQELNASQKPLIADSAPIVEATETIMDLICKTPEEIDVQMDDILMEEDNAFQSPNWEELLHLDFEELSKLHLRALI